MPHFTNIVLTRDHTLLGSLQTCITRYILRTVMMLQGIVLLLIAHNKPFMKPFHKFLQEWYQFI